MPPAHPRQHRRELWGWLSYAFASEVFAVCSLTLFLPICLEQFARDNGYLLPERTIRCVGAGTSLEDSEARCVVKIGWLWVDSASYSLYVYSASVAIQALTVISLGSVADDPRHRKHLLLSFALIGSISSLVFLLLPSSSPLWPLSALLAIAANVSFGTSIVALNSYLPYLARNSEPVQEALRNIEGLQADEPGNVAVQASGPEEEDFETDDERAPLTNGADGTPEVKEAVKEYNKELSAAISRISSNGIAIGYSAGILLLLVLLIPVTVLKGSTFSLRLAIGLTGGWWAAFTLPAASWLPSGPIKTGRRELGRGARISGQIISAWKKLGHMLRPTEMVRLRNTFWFLGAWFLLSDGFTTITSTAVLFAKTTLHMSASSLIIIGTLTPAAGIIGSLAWPRLQRRLGWSNLRALVGLVALAAVIPSYGCLGFLPFLGKGNKGGVSTTALRFGGLTSPAEMYVLAVYFGSLYGAFQSYARAVFAELIPPGEEARWFGLFSITDKSSSFLGPLVVGVIADTTGNIRFAFFFLVFMMLLPIPILLFKVDVDRGREDAKLYSEERDVAAST